MLQDAVADAEESISLNRGYAKAHNIKGAALEQLGQYAQAMEAYETGLLVDRDNKTLKDNATRLRSLMQSGARRPTPAAAASAVTGQAPIYLTIARVLLMFQVVRQALPLPGVGGASPHLSSSAGALRAGQHTVLQLLHFTGNWPSNCPFGKAWNSQIQFYGESGRVLSGAGRWWVYVLRFDSIGLRLCETQPVSTFYYVFLSCLGPPSSLRYSR